MPGGGCISTHTPTHVQSTSHTLVASKITHTLACTCKSKHHHTSHTLAANTIYHDACSCIHASGKHLTIWTRRQYKQRIQANTRHAANASTLQCRDTRHTTQLAHKATTRSALARTLSRDLFCDAPYSEAPNLGFRVSDRETSAVMPPTPQRRICTVLFSTHFTGLACEHSTQVPQASSQGLRFGVWGLGFWVSGGMLTCSPGRSPIPAGYIHSRGYTHSRLYSTRARDFPATS